MQSEVKKIVDLIKINKLISSKMTLSCVVQNIQFNITNRDIMGGVIQSWFEHWLTKNNVYWSPPYSTQSYPDFNLLNNQSLELKTFYSRASPAFDIGNFKSLIDDLIINAKRLNTDYIIFSYIDNDDKTFTLDKFWCKKIWQITTMPVQQKSAANYRLVSSQIKKGNIVNLRPFGFNKNPQNSFSSRYVFVEQIKKTIEKFKHQLIKSETIYQSSEDWFQMVENRFKQQTNTNL